MRNLTLLSEIHPAATQMFNPINQAHNWFSLLSKKDIARFQQGQALDFSDAIQLIEKRCRQKKKHLIIRDWAHLDFTGQPFTASPTHTLALADALQTDFTLQSIALVRHPIDQWLSLSRLTLMQDSIQQHKLTVQIFLDGYEAFAKHCSNMPFVRYEDFTHSPKASMQNICRQLELPFDARFLNHWSNYQTITGDVQSTRGGNEIQALKRRDFDSSLIKAFENEKSYWNSLKILGYAAVN